MMTKVEPQRLGAQWNSKNKMYYHDVCVHNLFEEQASLVPDSVALVYEDQHLTYQETDRQASQLAYYFYLENMGPEDIVGICVERSLEMIVGLLGILKAGAAYLPIDPTYPSDRITYILNDARISMLLCRVELAKKYERQGVKTICFDTDRSTLIQSNAMVMSHLVTSQNASYIIYTSGSTGIPKGTVIEHQQLLNYLSGIKAKLQINEPYHYATVSTIAADLGNTVIFLSLSSGGTLHIISEDRVRNPESFADIFEQRSIDCLKIVPSHLTALLSSSRAAQCLPQRILILGGEALYWEDIKRLKELSSSMRIFNHYGPTEATIGVLVCPVNDQAKSDLCTGVPLGKPIANTQVYLLDDSLNPVSIGITADLYIGGMNITRGYLSRPDLTAERFIPHMFSKDGKRLYKTGDLARYNCNEDIEFLGRIDDQVKIHGHRVELGEIEAVLVGHDEISEAIVIARENKTKNRYLSAYIKPRQEYECDPQNQLKYESDQIKRWQQVHDIIYSKNHLGKKDLDQNFNGWTSSYTREPIPNEQMIEWLDHTVQRIMSLKPKRVLEIGCGGGLLLFRIVKFCQAYWGLDFSPTILRDVRAEVRKRSLNQVTLIETNAENLDGLAHETFDLIILNSTLQYFPSLDCLLRILRRSLQHLKPGGHLFIGDVRNHTLLDAFHLSVLLFQLLPKVSVEELRNRLYYKLADERELVVDPMLFTKLHGILDGIGRVEVLMKRGRYHNELNDFRYDVIIHFDNGSSESVEVDQWIDWEEQGWTLKTVKNRLVKDNPKILGIKHIPNMRLVKYEKILRSIEESYKEDTIEDLLSNSSIAQHTREIDPEEIAAIAEEQNYKIVISYSPPPKNCYFDVLIVQTPGELPHALGSVMPLVNYKIRPVSLRSLVNNPLHQAMKNTLIPKVKSYLASQLPEYMMPNYFICLDHVPLTPNGKIDRSRLPDPRFREMTSEGQDELPRNQTEEVLVNIWAQLFEVKKLSIRDNFFELGGHSLLAMKLLTRIKQELNSEISLLTIFDEPTIAGLAKCIEKSSKQKKDVSWPRIHPVEAAKEYHLSFAQQRMWFLGQIERESPFYNYPFAVRMRGLLNPVVLEDCLNEIVRRHEALRTSFPDKNGKPVQVIEPKVTLALEIIDLDHQSRFEWESAVRKLAADEAHRPFTLDKGMLLRIRLIRWNREEHVLLLTIHHIAFDGWSVDILNKELKILYTEFSVGKPSLLKELILQYKDFANWQRQWMQGPELNRQLAYWKQKLHGAPYVLELPTDFPRPAHQSYRGSRYPFSLSVNLSEELMKLAKKRGCTLYMVLFSAFNIMLRHYTGCSDILVGSPVMNRNDSETEKMIGVFINTLVLRPQFSDDMTFDHVLIQLRKMILEACANQDLPFEILVEHLKPIRDMSRNPLFQVMFVLYETSPGCLSIPGLEINELDVARGTSKFDLALSMLRTKQGIKGEFEYSTDLFKENTIGMAVLYYQSILERIIAQPDRKITELNVIDEISTLEVTRLEQEAILNLN